MKIVKFFEILRSLNEILIFLSIFRHSVQIDPFFSPFPS